MSVLLRVFMAALLMLAASFAGCVLSAEEGNKRPVLRAVYGEFYPYGFTAPDGTAQGYSIDVTRVLADQAGYDVRFIHAENPQQFLDMLRRGKADLTPFLALTPQRRAAGLATGPLGEYALSVYVRRDSEVTDIAVLSGQRIGVVVGSINQIAAEMLPDVTLVEYQTSDAQVLPLLRGEIDAVVEVAETFEELLRNSFIEEKVRALEPPLAVTPYGIIVRRDLPIVYDAFERVLGQPQTPARIQEIRAKWFGQDRSIVEYPWFGNVALIVGGIALTTIALGIYAVRLRRRSVVLVAEFSTNQLLIDAFDHMRAGIVIFDASLRAVHWNSGFESRFPEMRVTLQNGATLNQIYDAIHRTGMDPPDQDKPEEASFVAATSRTTQEGITEQRIVHTRDGNSFDLSMFPLGAKYYAAIWVDMTELHEQQQQLADQRSELMRKNQQLLTFSSMAAHDLKAPLIQQKMLMEFIAEDLVDARMSLPVETESHFATLSDLSGRMSVLVSDLLDYAKADTDQGKSWCFAPNARLEGIVKLAAPAAQMKVEIMPDIPLVQVEPTCFDMVMRNLITNAAKHHDKPTGKITLRGYRAGGQVIIEVEDDGPGIKKSDEARVFEPFARLTQVEGTGLGLAFVKRTVTTWGGSVSVRPAPVRGAVFCISIPAPIEAIAAQ